MVKSDRRPSTATLIKPTVLDAKLLGIFDMSTVSREHLIAIRNLVHGTPRCKCTPVGAKCKSFGFCSSKLVETDARIQRMCKVLNKTYRIRGNASRQRLLGDVPPEKTPVVPAPCATCGRQDQPERFHSHPSRVEVKAEPREAEPQRKTVQKPVAIKFRSANSKIRQEPVKAETSLAAPANLKIVKETTKPARKPVNEEDKENDMAAAAVSKVDRKVKLVTSKWKEAIGKDIRQKRQSSQITASEILTKIRDKQQQQQHHLSSEADVALGGYKLDSWNPAPVSGGRKRKVVCYLCAQEFGTAALPSHEAQCIRKYLKSNERASEANRSEDGNQEPPLSQAREHWKLAWELTQASLIGCKLCDRKFLPTRLEAHQKSCFSKGNSKHRTKSNNKVLMDVHSVPSTSDVLCEHCGKWYSSSSISMHRQQHTKKSEPQSQQLRRSPASQPLAFAFVICHICGQNFGDDAIASHQRQCAVKWRLQKEKFSPELSKSWFDEESDVTSNDYTNELTRLDETDSRASQELFWEAHQAQLVPCPKCARTFFPQRLEIHLRGCKGPTKNKLR